MSWHDKQSIEQILKLKDKYKMSTFVETGVFKGVNVRLHSFYWDVVRSCDISKEHISIAKEYVSDRDNVFIEKSNSADFLRNFVDKYNRDGRSDIVFIYLDAHFYNSIVSERWVVLKELASLKGFKNCVIVMHDFDCCGLGHLCYDGEHFGFPLILDSIRAVNPDIHMYVNTKDMCEIYDEETILERKELIINENVLDNVRFTNSCDRLKYRGILYCTPTELDLEVFNLRKA